ncbi:hypothetical protein [Flavobacterium sp. 245]|uniref:hypothetical protein n=1 Tax=Flavobacterium sp. 245 TaxID=2512115 RepID=UPI00105DD5CA|nr:hypothetical protein [Flavobacterium sp. 245]TDO96561.1 hypothetical protein EV145_11159 [Flavobacterium sp. 245]
MYNESFRNLVNLAFNKSKEFYKSENNLNKPNPYFVGFGNPNSKILILGKEKGFDVNNLKQLQYESIENPNEWKNYIDSGVTLNRTKFYDSEHYINVFCPYLAKMKGGHTWTKYFTLLKHIYPQIEKNENEFLDYTFLSEINFEPSKLSKIKAFNNPNRIELLKNNYYKSFNVIICACGDYLSDNQIEDFFDVKFESDLSNPSEKLKIFKNENRVLINTRQLSMNIKNDYLVTISEVAKKYL